MSFIAIDIQCEMLCIRGHMCLMIIELSMSLSLLSLCGRQQSLMSCAERQTHRSSEPSILHLGHDSHQKIFSLVQVVPGPVQPYRTELWLKTPFIYISHCRRERSVPGEVITTVLTCTLYSGERIVHSTLFPTEQQGRQHEEMLARVIATIDY